MQWDDLRAVWAEQDSNPALRLNLRLLRQLTVERARGVLRWSAAETLAGVSLLLLALLWLGGFAYAHRAFPPFWIPALLLHLYGIGLTIWTIRHAVATLAVDFTRPISEIQCQLAALRRSEMHRTQFVLFTAALVWVPIFIVLLKGCFGVDVYRSLGARWIWWNLAFGAALIPVLHRAARWASARAAAHPGLLRDLIRDAGGHRLRHAESIVAEIKEIER